MADLRIVDAPLLSTVKGTEKIPTGGEGNFSISVNQVADFAKLKLVLAAEGYVDNAVDNVQANLNLHENNATNPHQVTKAQVGLGNVDNTADLDKPVSNATQSALDTKAVKAQVIIDLNLKADKITTYTKTEVDSEFYGIYQNGAALPYDAAMEYAENAVVVKDGELQKKQGASWVSATNKGYNLDYFISGKSYPLHSEIMLTNGNIVKSTVANNTVNPNTNMTGWLNIGNTGKVESIADLLAIQNPKDGNRVFVKSYHEGFNKGGDDFYYDSTKSLINNGVTIFNGWVRSCNPSDVDAFMAGAVGVGDHTSYLDHEGLRRLAAYVKSEYNSGVTDIKVTFNKGEYITQKQFSGLTSDIIQPVECSFELTECPNLKLTIHYDSATFTIRNSLRIGTFNRSDLTPYTGSAPFFGDANTVFFTPERVVVVWGISELIVTGVSSHNGNVQNHIVGGVYGDTGIQGGSIGAQYINIDKMDINGYFLSHSHTNDGFYIAGTNPTATKDDLTDGRFMRIKGLVATNNGRNGISFTGGKNSSWYDVLTFNNGLDSHPTPTLPRSNLDIEAEVSPIRCARFYNLKSNQAGADGVVADSGDSRDVIFYDSSFINKSRSLWINKSEFKLYDCYINGSMISGYGTEIEKDRTRYVDCTFEDNISVNPELETRSYLIQLAAKNLIFDGCTFNVHQDRFLWGTYFSPTKYTTFKNCEANIYTPLGDFMFGGFEFDGFRINDMRANPAAFSAMVIASSNFKDFTINCETAISGIYVYGDPNNFDQNLNKFPQFEKTIVSNYPASKSTNAVTLQPKYTTQYEVGNSAFIKVFYIDSIAELKLNTEYTKGDTAHCTDPIGQSGIQKWVCTTSGFYGTSAWAGTKVYAVGSYVNANSKVYKCTIAGTSSTTAPSHTGGTSTDGTVTWEYVSLVAVFTPYS